MDYPRHFIFSGVGALGASQLAHVYVRLHVGVTKRIDEENPVRLSLFLFCGNSTPKALAVV